MSSAACGSIPKPKPPPRVVAKAIKDTPPAELTRCPEPPRGFPADASAVMPGPVREAVIRLASAYAADSAQLRRLINWLRPGACPDPAGEAAE